MLYTVRSFWDYYNERGQYKMFEIFCTDLETAKKIASKADRALVLMPRPNRLSSEIVHSIGFLY